MNMNKRFFALAALMAISLASYTHCAEAPVARVRSYTTVAVGSAALIGLIGVIYETIISTMSGDTSIVQTIANAFLQTTPAFVSLQKDIREITETKSEEEKAQAVTALKGLVALLEAPGELHKLLTRSTSTSVVTALNYAPTASFVAKIQAIVQNNFCKLIDGEVQLSQDGYIFYNIIKQMLTHVFSDLLPEYTDRLKDPTSIATISKPAIATKAISAQDMLRQAISHDLAEEVKEAVEAGADANETMENSDMSYACLAVFLRKNNAIKALIDTGRVSWENKCKSPTGDNFEAWLNQNVYPQYDLKTLIALIKSGYKKNDIGHLSVNMGQSRVWPIMPWLFNTEATDDQLELARELIKRGYPLCQQEQQNCCHKANGDEFPSNLGGPLQNICMDTWDAAMCDRSALPNETGICKSPSNSAKKLQMLVDLGTNPDQWLGCNIGRDTCGGTGYPIEKVMTVTPLILAIAYRNIAAIKFLLSSGIDVNKRVGRHAWTPLGTAIFERDALADGKKSIFQPRFIIHDDVSKLNEIISILIEHGAKLQT